MSASGEAGRRIAQVKSTMMRFLRFAKVADCCLLVCFSLEYMAKLM